MLANSEKCSLHFPRSIFSLLVLYDWQQETIPLTCCVQNIYKNSVLHPSAQARWRISRILSQGRNLPAAIYPPKLLAGYCLSSQPTTLAANQPWFGYASSNATKPKHFCKTEPEIVRRMLSALNVLLVRIICIWLNRPAHVFPLMYRSCVLQTVILVFKSSVGGTGCVHVYYFSEKLRCWWRHSDCTTHLQLEITWLTVQRGVINQSCITPLVTIVCLSYLRFSSELKCHSVKIAFCNQIQMNDSDAVIIELQIDVLTVGQRLDHRSLSVTNIISAALFPMLFSKYSLYSSHVIWLSDSGILHAFQHTRVEWIDEFKQMCCIQCLNVSDCRAAPLQMENSSSSLSAFFERF